MDLIGKFRERNSIIEKLILMADASFDQSVNQPMLPHLIIVINKLSPDTDVCTFLLYSIPISDFYRTANSFGTAIRRQTESPNTTAW